MIKKISFLFVLSCLCIACNQFWQGEVHPGEYTGSYDLDGGSLGTAHVDVTIYVIGEHSAEIREVWRGEKCRSGNRVYYGEINKFQETYNGETKIWYGVIGGSKDPTTDIMADYSLTPSLELYDSYEETYQGLIDSKKLCRMRSSN